MLSNFVWPPFGGLGMGDHDIRTTWHWDSGVCQEPGQIEDFVSREYQSRMD